MSDSTKEKQENKVTKKPKAEPAYSKAEILASAKAFGVTVDVMAGSLRRVDKERLTRVEVEKAIHDFKGKQV